MKIRLLAVLLLEMSVVGLTQDSPSSPWKEYIYPDNGFAITLPGDPHPHKSSQMQNGVAYSVPLSDGIGFSLHTMEVNERCVEAVRSQSATYEKIKNAPSNGFKAISFREVSGAGFTGVEFVQQVPNGKIDFERWVCGSCRLYVLASAWNPSQSEPKELRRILDSFRVITSK